MEGKISNDDFYAIEVPAIVNNDEQLIESLGGPDEIFHVFECDKRRLKLSFRPHMVYAKPVCGDVTTATGLILNVKCLKNRVTGETKIVPKIIGRVRKMYKFEAMSDFQFGPFERVSSDDPMSPSAPQTGDQYRVFYQSLIVKEPTTFLDPILSRDAPLFLPPLLFSRQDVPFNYNFASRYRSSDYIEMEEKIEQCAVSRKSRPSHSCIVRFEDPTPLAPHPLAVQRMMSYLPMWSELSVKLSQLFQKRPIWLRSAIVQHTKAEGSSALLKYGLLCSAYYMVHGPWSRAWIRFGYDPRLDPESRHYQIMDFRINSPTLVRKILQRHGPRRSVPHILTHTKRNFRPNRRSMEGNLFFMGSEADGLKPLDTKFTDGSTGEAIDGEDQPEQDTALHFSRNSLPRSQQMMVCLTDIDIPEVQDILSEPPDHTACHPVDGWLNPGQAAKIRELMSKHLYMWLSDDAENRKSQISTD